MISADTIAALEKDNIEYILGVCEGGVEKLVGIRLALSSVDDYI
jgi:hypothetical protein